MNLASGDIRFSGIQITPDDVGGGVAEYLPIEALKAGFVGIFEQPAGDGVIGSQEVAVGGSEDFLPCSGDFLFSDCSRCFPVLVKVKPFCKELVPGSSVSAGAILE